MLYVFNMKDNSYCVLVYQKDFAAKVKMHMCFAFDSFDFLTSFFFVVSENLTLKFES